MQHFFWDFYRPWYGEASFAFCSLDFRLLSLWWLVRLNALNRQYKWALHQHCCSCDRCNQHKRKVQGNGMKGKSIQELRELQRA